MDKPTHPVDGDTNSSALSASTIEFLTAHGFIRQANDSGLALETVLQGLHSGDGDEQDELTTDDDDDDEQLAAQLIEPKGRNPQQQIFSEKPTGPSTLVEESKALIKREPLPREATLLQGKKEHHFSLSWDVDVAQICVL